MDYNETIEWLYVQLPMFQSIGVGAYKPGLDTAYALSSAFGNPHQRLKAIHVAGTNGKGSTSHAIASVLMAQGYKVGLYTSPHLFDFRERIRINGEKIDKQSVVDFIEKYRQMELGLQPSFFELTTILAFDYFARQEVDYAVIEVGLGGRLDTTNIITPVLSIITNISVDHASLLGDTPAAIAKEKAGIIKPGVPVVISEADSEVRQVFEDKAKEVGAPITFAQDTHVLWSGDIPVAGTYAFGIRPSETPVATCDLQGEWQVRNINGVMHALQILDNVSDAAIISGLANVQTSTGLMGRWMTIAQNPEVVCDTGHNLGSWQYLAPKLAKIADEKKTRIVLGFANDKDVESIFPMLPKNAEYLFAAPAVKRARPAADLMALAEKHGLKARALDSVKDAYNQAIAESKAADFVFVGGSNFVVAELPMP